MSPFIRFSAQNSPESLEEHSTTVHFLDLKVIPNAKRNQVVGLLGNKLKVKVSAPPEAGKANEAVVRLIAQELQIKASRITLAKGHAVPEKTLRIDGLTSTQIRARLLSNEAGKSPQST